MAHISEKLNQLDLILYSPVQKEFDEFIQLQTERIKADLGEDRTRVREHKIFLMDLWEKIRFGLSRLRQILEPELALKEEFDTLIKTYAPQNPDHLFDGNQNFPNFEIHFFLQTRNTTRNRFFMFPCKCFFCHSHFCFSRKYTFSGALD